MTDLPKYLILEKAVGETPLACLEKYRAEHPELSRIPLAYAGRLDPMASGKLLVLVGEECKKQTEYHGLDKEYEFSILFGIDSDTQDVLGRLTTCTIPENITTEKIELAANRLLGLVALPYPHFSSKTVAGKPLHTWALENRLHEIEIPTNKSTIYELELLRTETKPRTEAATEARKKIDTIPPVTDLRKAIGNDFRRADVRQDWKNIKDDYSLPDTYLIAHFRCTASAGTYMRSLAKTIAEKLGTCGLAWHIHRTKIGRFNTKTQSWESEF